MKKILILIFFINYILNAYFITHDEEICLIDDLNKNNNVLIKFKFASNSNFTVNIKLKNMKGETINQYEVVTESEKNIAYTHKEKGDIFICLIADNEVETEYSIFTDDDEKNKFIAKSADLQEINLKIIDEIKVFKNIISRNESMLQKEDEIYNENISLNKMITRLCIIEILLVLFMAGIQYYILNGYVKKNQYIN